MATITLNSMTCEQLQDSITSDEIEVRVGGVEVLGPIGVHKGQRVSLGGATRSFTGSTSVQLVELDGNNRPDNLGIRIVSDDEAGSGSHDLVFNAANKALYTLNYRVT